MRQRAAAGFAALTLAGILLFNFKGPSDAALATSIKANIGGTTPGSGNSGTGTTGTGTTGTTGAASGAGTGSTASGTFTGSVAPDPYGDVQVQITVKNGKITNVKALSLPMGGHSGQISNYVAPILRSEALTAQSANIQGVSGATYTSQAYAQSLQGALDAAGL